MKTNFLKKISEVNFDNFISNFMDYKESVGSGVGAGKAFEKFFCTHINKEVDGFFAIHLNLSNSKFIWDVIITDNSNALNLKEQIISIIRNDYDIENEISNCIGNNWLGLSLKTYKDDACQITTDYSYRTWLEDKAPNIDLPDNLVEDFFNILNKHDKSRYLIIALNTYDNELVVNQEIKKLEKKLSKLKKASKISETNQKIKDLKSEQPKNVYTLRLLEFEKTFDKIEFKKNSKLSQYDISVSGVKLFKVLYGKNQANPFQRGIWTHNKNSIEYFELVKSGNYESVDYTKVIEETISMSPIELKKVLSFIKTMK